MMEWIIFGIYFIILLFIIKRWTFFQSAASFRMMSVIFIIKILCGAGVAVLYSSYYKYGDTFAYMHDANVFCSAVKHSPSTFLKLLTGINAGSPALQQYYSALEGDSGTGYGQWFNNYLIFVRILSLLSPFSFGYYYVVVLLLVFLSLTGLTAIYKLTGKGIAVCISVFFTPSVIFWGSGLLKESFLIFLTGAFLYLFNNMLNPVNWKKFACFTASACLLFLLKPFFIIIMLPGLVAWYIYKLRDKRLIATFFSAYTVAFLITLLLRLAGDKYDVYAMLHNQQIIFMKNAVFYRAGSLIELIPFAPEPFSVIKRTPEALMVALGRPFIWESHTMMQYLAAAENCLVLLFIIFMIYKSRWKQVQNNPFSLLAIIAGLTLLAVTAFTTPVLGTLVRLKSVPLLLLLSGLSGLQKNNGDNIYSRVKSPTE